VPVNIAVQRGHRQDDATHDDRGLLPPYGAHGHRQRRAADEQYPPSRRCVGDQDDHQGRDEPGRQRRSVRDPASQIRAEFQLDDPGDQGQRRERQGVRLDRSDLLGEQQNPDREQLSDAGRDDQERSLLAVPARARGGDAEHGPERE
jgi:hypothetical protein